MTNWVSGADSRSLKAVANVRGRALARGMQGQVQARHPTSAAREAIVAISALASLQSTLEQLT